MKRPCGMSIAGMVLAGMFGLLMGSGVFTFTYAEGLSYMSDDPRACVNCHVMRDQYDGWQKSSHHANATCNDCHVPKDFVGKYMTKVEHGWRHSKGFTLQDFHEPIRITKESLDTVQMNCVRCHEALTEEIRGVAGAGTAQSAHDLGMKCTHCHTSVGHGPVR